MRVLSWVSKTRLDGSWSSVCLRLAGVSLVGAALSDWDVQRSLMFILGLMLWSEGVLPPNGECRRSGREVCDKISS